MQNDTFRSERTGTNFWIGLHNEDQLNGSSNCTCNGCEECRNKFDWVDDRAGPGYIDWARNEPQKIEACVRLTHGRPQDFFQRGAEFFENLTTYMGAFYNPRKTFFLI